MSLINEALKQAETTGRDDQTPPVKRSTHGIKDLYADKSLAGPERSGVDSAEEISRLLTKNQTSLRGAAALGVCVIAAVGVIMHLTLPPDQRGPVEAEAGGAIDALETQTHQSAEKTGTTPEKSPEKTTIAALQQALAGVLSRNADKTPKTASTNEPAEKIHPAGKEQNPGDKPNAGKFTLSGILASGGKGYAIVNNHMVTVGDNIDGAKVVTVGKHHVVLEKGGKRFTLRM